MLCRFLILHCCSWCETSEKLAVTFSSQLLTSPRLETRMAEGAFDAGARTPLFTASNTAEAGRNKTSAHLTSELFITPPHVVGPLLPRLPRYILQPPLPCSLDGAHASPGDKSV